MKRPMINATLFNVPTEDDEYLELRRAMVDEVTGDEMDQPLDTKLAMLEDYVSRMFADMEDEVLQQHYDSLMEYKNETNEEAKAQEEQK